MDDNLVNFYDMVNKRIDELIELYPQLELKALLQTHFEKTNGARGLGVKIQLGDIFFLKTSVGKQRKNYICNKNGDEITNLDEKVLERIEEEFLFKINDYEKRFLKIKIRE